MTLLLPYNVSESIANKFLWYFYKSLKDENVDIVASQEAWINKSKNFKAVIIHWPEHLPQRKYFNSEEDFLAFTIERIRYFKKFSKIFYFVHNIEPHLALKNINKRLYEEIIYNSTAIFHFGDFSKNLYLSKYKIIQNQFIIPHGNYLDLKKQKIIQGSAENKIKLNYSNTTISVIGPIRDKNEFTILRNFAKYYLKENCNFIYCGNIVNDFVIHSTDGKLLISLKKFLFNKLGLKKFIKNKRISSLRNLGKNITIIPKRISDELLIEIIDLSDILLICRYGNLNSGNVALGFTFGCYVVGPNQGNIGEILRKYNNSVYDIKNTKYNKVVLHSLEAFREGIGKNNLKISKLYWDWSILGKKYKSIFEKFNVV